MRRTWCALALGIIASTAASAQDLTCVVGQGETLSQIAARYGVPTIKLAHANCINQIHKLKLGQSLIIPGWLHPKDPKAEAKKTAYSALTAPTDASGRLAAMVLISQATFLPGAAPKTALNKAPAKKSSAVAGKAPAAPVKVAAKQTKVAVKHAASPKGGTYKVVDGDNDWVIAHKFSTKPSLIRAANPNVNWARLKIGTTLQLPNGSTKAGKGNSGGIVAIRTRRALIARDAVNIRRGPGSETSVVTTVDQGTAVTVLDRESGWYKLKFPRGTVGWVRGDMLKPLSAAKYAKANRGSKHRASTREHYAASKAPYNAKTGNGALDGALAMIGTRYSYGSASRSATDCSGLVLQNYRKVGVSLPRRSRDMSRVGTSISKGELKPGDLVFFHTGRSRRVNHVGIYKGNGEFVHASSARGRVRVDRLSDGYYASRYVGAKRPVGGKATKAAKSASLAKAESKAAETKQEAVASKPVGEHKSSESDAGK